MLEEKLRGLSVSLIDEQIVEIFRFTSDHLAATIGTRDGPVCAPILSLEIVGPAALRIVGQGFEISWDQIEIGPETLSVRRNGIPANYRIENPPVQRGTLPGHGSAQMNAEPPDAPDKGGEAANGTGFHLHPMYIVYAVVAVLALAWDWRVLIAFAVLMAAAWLFARFDDKRQQNVVFQSAQGSGDPAPDPWSAEEASPVACPTCNTPLFGVQVGVTTAAEIAAFAKNAEGWRDNPEAIAGWMPPGLYCANGCYALHATPVPMLDPAQPAPEPARLPKPVRITLADVVRDGGSYELNYDSDRGEAIKVVLRVITEGALKRIGYHPPRLSRLDPKTLAAVDTWAIDWDEAETLAARLQPLPGLAGSIKVGSAARAREMILYLRRRGKL